MADDEGGSAGSVNLAGNSKPPLTSVSGPTSAAAGSTASFVAQQAIQHAGQQVVQETVSNALSGAGRVLRQGATEVRLYVESNPYSVTMLSFIGGIILALSSLWNVIFVPSFFLGPMQYLLHCYQLLFALIICIIDGPGDRIPTLRSKVMGVASFLHTNASRSLFYLFIACLEGQQDGVFRQAIAWYFAGIAVGHGLLSFMKQSPAPGSNQADLQQGLSSA